ncbi:MAG: hypothetical protein SVV80_04640 [Planctomycetota bacterium]|nr:hypothetical protein [Planctomycetota bacterium]
MAHWLYRNLQAVVDRIVVCDLRRNACIAKDGDMDGPIDAGKPAVLLRGIYLREVYRSDDDRHVLLKQWVSLYHDRVREAVLQNNKLRGRCRMYGVRPHRGALRDPSVRFRWLKCLEDRALVKQLSLLWIGLNAVLDQVVQSRREVSRLGRRHQIIRYWGELPGVGPIRAATLFAYLDTPLRFRHRRK